LFCGADLAPLCHFLWELFAIVGDFFVPLPSNNKLNDLNDESSTILFGLTYSLADVILRTETLPTEECGAQ
jgi:hypothetical protein